MQRSTPQPEIRKTPTGGKMIYCVTRIERAGCTVIRTTRTADKTMMAVRFGSRFCRRQISSKEIQFP
jgi:hypothetical protein